MVLQFDVAVVFLANVFNFQMTFVYARGIWSVKHSHSHSYARLNHSPALCPLPLPPCLVSSNHRASRQPVSKCKPNRSLGRLRAWQWEREGEGEWERERGLPSGFQLGSVWSFPMHVAICTADTSRLLPPASIRVPAVFSPCCQ